MKTAREHRVPLCGGALKILEAARKLGAGESPMVNERGRPVGGKRMRRLLGKHGIATVPDRFRSSFRDWAAEDTDHPMEVVKAALPANGPKQGRAAYMRSDLFERWGLMDDLWDCLAGPESRHRDLTRP